MLTAPVLAVILLIAPIVAAAQPPEATETIDVLGPNSTAVATLLMPRSGIQASEIAVLVNDNDRQSIEVAEYYQRARKIPDQNMIHLNFDQTKTYPGFSTNQGIDPADFAALKAQVDAAAGQEIQALVISWSRPFRIARFNYYPTNYSITSAFSFGVDAAYLTSANCAPTPASPIYDSSSTTPYTDFGIRPSMMLAGVSAASVKATIDKGLLADRTLPNGTGWFVRTRDAARSIPRNQDFQVTVQNWNRPEALSMKYLDRSSVAVNSEITHAHNILFYQTGLANLSGLNTNTYVPGALADHLTSAGGDLFGTSQMSALRWLEAGVAASYGTVTEPCAYAEKFPAASVLVKNYFVGNTAVEAYSKSVGQPAQGVLVGDPLARPFGTKSSLLNGVLTIHTTSLEPGANYNLYSAPSPHGPFALISTVSVPSYQFVTIIAAGLSEPVYKIEKRERTTTQKQ